MVVFSAIEELRKDTKEGWKKLAVPLDQVIEANNASNVGLKKRDVQLACREDIMDGRVCANRVKIDELSAKVALAILDTLLLSIDIRLLDQQPRGGVDHPSCSSRGEREGAMSLWTAGYFRVVLRRGDGPEAGRLISFSAFISAHRWVLPNSCYGVGDSSGPRS